MTDQKTNCATTTSSRPEDLGCSDCGWSKAGDLVWTWVLGRRLALCINPWRCSQRQADLRGAFDLPLGSAVRPVTG